MQWKRGRRGGNRPLLGEVQPSGVAFRRRFLESKRRECRRRTVVKAAGSVACFQNELRPAGNTETSSEPQIVAVLVAS